MTNRSSPSSRAADPASGKIARYELLELLGEGSAGAVYKAADPDLERCVALRWLTAGLVGQGKDRLRLIRDAQIAASLEHANICPLYEIGETADGGFFLVSALCEGETLEQVMAGGPTRLETAVELAAQIAAAAGHAHERGLVHGRLRPSNVWIGTDGQIRVVDFGLAGLCEQTWAQLPPSASPNAGSFHAPELLHGDETSARSDVWAIGALLLGLLDGRPPEHAGPASLEKLELPADLPSNFAQALARALAFRPADRQADAGELHDDLRQRRRAQRRAAEPATAGTRPAAWDGNQPISKYWIKEQLGSGGMGVVYRAEDVQLGRTVALKFLPQELARDPGAKARFLQEARAASALDHPNVCTVYELGETGERQLFLAMPCYEGETLRTKLSRGPLPLSDALDYALQAARGLAKAHRQGIVHRDVKPANLMVTGDGLVKILDFGVAKLAGEAGLTRAGKAVGTPSYMSPEQLRAEPVGTGTDLWSLGVVLYEMLTGRRPFPGESYELVREAVLRGAYEPLARQRPDVPPVVAGIVDRLLAPKPADRYPTAEALAADLKSVLDSLTLSRPLPSAEGWTGARLLPRPRIPRAALWSAGAALVLALILGGLLWLRRGPAPQAAKEASVVRLTEQEGEKHFPSLSPDGKFFVYTAIQRNDEDIFLQRVGGGNPSHPINLTPDSPGNDTQPVYSPDGSAIAFRSDRDGGGLFLMGATGESVRRVTDRGYQPTWSPDGQSLAYATEEMTDPTVRSKKSQIWRVDIATSRGRMLADGGARQPAWSPAAQRIAYWAEVGDQSAHIALYTVGANGGPPTVLLEENAYNWSPAWAPDGRYLYFLSDRGGSMNLWRLAVDPESGARRGDPEPVTLPAQTVSHFSLSRDGHKVLYATEEGGGSVDRVDLAAGKAAGSLQPVTRIKKKILSAAPSPDGQWLVLYAQSPQEDLFLMRSDGTGLRQLTDDPFHDRLPRWSPDGSRIYFYTDRNGRYEIWTIRPDGSDPAVAASRKSGDLFSPVPSPDGRWLACRDFSSAALVDLSRPVAERQAVPLAVPGLEKKIFVPRSWSSDMKWLAGTVHDPEVMKREGMGIYSPATGAFQKLPGDGLWPTFLADGETVLYLSQGQDRIFGWSRRTGQTWPVVSPPEGSIFKFFAPTSDGRTLYTVRVTSEGDIWLLDFH